MVNLLAGYGVTSKSSIELGWRHLVNGELVKTAVENSFTCIITRDGLFGQSANQALKSYPDIAVVIVNLPQRRRDPYLAAFNNAWTSSPIVPEKGKVIHWPSP